MTTRTSSAQWRGDLPSGDGDLELGSGRFAGPYTFVSRFESGEGGTNPEELLAAAHAACYSMALSGALSKEGATVESVDTSATVHLGKADGSSAITRIELSTVGKVTGIDEDAFRRAAEQAKDGCPVSKLFAGGSAEIVLEARLAG